MHTDNYINDQTKQYLKQTDVKPGRFTSFLKYTKEVTQDALLYYLIAVILNAYHISLSTTFNL